MQVLDGGSSRIADGGGHLLGGTVAHGERVAIAVEGALVGTLRGVANHHLDGTDVDVAVHDGVDVRLSAVHEVGECHEVLLGVEQVASCGILLAAFRLGEVVGNLHHMAVVVPRVGLLHRRAGDGGQCHQGVDLAGGAPRLLGPLPHAGVGAADAVGNGLALVLAEQRLVGVAVAPLALLVADGGGDGHPVGVDAGIGAADVALDFEVVAVEHILQVGVVDAPRQQGIARVVDGGEEVLRIVHHEGGARLRLDVDIDLLAFGVIDVGLHIDVAPGTVGRDVESAHQFTLVEVLRVFLAGQGIGVVEFCPHDAACLHAVGEHLLVDVFAVVGQHGFAQLHRHGGGRRTVPGEQRLPAVFAGHVVSVVAVFALGPAPERQFAATQVAGGCPDDGGGEVVIIVVVAAHGELDGIGAEGLIAAGHLARHLVGAAKVALYLDLFALFAVDVAVVGHIPVDETLVRAAVDADLDLSVGDTFVQKRTPHLRGQGELHLVGAHNRGGVVVAVLQEVVGQGRLGHQPRKEHGLQHRQQPALPRSCLCSHVMWFFCFLL